MAAQVCTPSLRVAVASSFAPFIVLGCAKCVWICGGRSVGEARAVGGRLAGLSALLHRIDAALSSVPRLVAAGVPAEARTQSNSPRGSWRLRRR